MIPFPETLSLEEFAKACKALGHPARLKILSFLHGSDTCMCGNIVRSLPLAQSTVSQHLKALKQAGLIVGEVDGPRTCYCLDKEMIRRFKRTVESLWSLCETEGK